MRKRHIVFFIGAIGLIYFVYCAVRTSVFIRNQDRVNMVFYGKTSVFYSFGQDNVNYAVPFSSQIEFLIPGGYGYYKVGALGKLVSLERKPDLFRRAFSVNTSSFVDIYFYPRSPIVYYDSSGSSYDLPTMSDMFFSPTNGSFLDRLFVWYYFLNKNKTQFKVITDLPTKKETQRIIFDKEEFFKQYQGYFYKKSYRKENNTVQLLYTKSFKTAELISQLLEGEGIRVVDISLREEPVSRTCLISQNTHPISRTTEMMQLFFSCKLANESSEVSDILFVLGPLEKEFLVE